MITLYNSDCLIEMNRISDKSISLILCDLPYGSTNNKWDIIINFNDLWAHYNRLLADNGNIVLFGNGIFSSKLMLSNEKMFKYKIIWHKSKATNFLNVKKQPLRKYEEILVFYNKGIYNPQFSYGEPYNRGLRKKSHTDSYNKFNNTVVKSDDGKRNPTDVIYFPTAETEGKAYHPTQKPVKLMEYLIKTYSNDGDMVLDNCMGSGTTGLACKNTNRNFIGIEKDLNYFNIANERINVNN